MLRKLLQFALALSLGLWGSVGLAQARPVTAPNPVLTIAAAPWPLIVNQGARVTVTASNAGPDNANNVTITAGIPNNMGLSNVSATQGQVTVSNMSVTVFAGTLAPGQTMYVYLDVVVVSTYPSDAPFNLCAGLTYVDGTARLSCLPNQTALGPGYRPSASLPPNGMRPINNPNRPPVYLPVSGAPIDLLGPFALLSGSILLAIGLRRRRH